MNVVIFEIDPVVWHTFEKIVKFSIPGAQVLAIDSPENATIPFLEKADLIICNEFLRNKLREMSYGPAQEKLPPKKTFFYKDNSKELLGMKHFDKFDLPEASDEYETNETISFIKCNFMLSVAKASSDKTFTESKDLIARLTT